MKFTKMQGTGNDYVYINCFEETVERPEELAVKVSDRHFGIGSDGLILICPSGQADCRMKMFNADGSESEMCGNGIRCVGKYVYDHHIVEKDEFDVETKAGIKHLKVTDEGGKASLITVDMGIPEVTGEVPEPIMIDGRSYEFIGISMGNPHAIYYMDEIDGLDLEAMGPAFETHKRFSGTDQLRVYPGDRQKPSTHACVGARKRRDVGLRHRSDGERCSLHLKRQDGEYRGGGTEGGNIKHNLGPGERPCVYDRTGCGSISGGI